MITLVLSWLIVVLGVAILVRTAAEGGGGLGFLLGALFILAGGGRLYLQRRSG